MSLFHRASQEGTEPLLLKGPETDIVTLCFEEPQITLPDGWIGSSGSDVGTRAYQQDYLALEVIGEDIVAIICDGMGGLENGELASAAAAEAFLERYRTERPGDLHDFMKNLAPKLDNAVFEATGGIGGTTLVCAVVRERNLYFLALGDSKLYIHRQGELIAVTSEQNYRSVLNRRLCNGEIRQSVYDKELVHGDALVCYLGAGHLEYMELSHAPIRLLPGDTLLLCSDGLYRVLSEEKLSDVLTRFPGSFSAIAPYLIQRSIASSEHRDNISVVALHLNPLE